MSRHPRPTSLYFAYGSNLDPSQMARRCPASAPVAPARLDAHRLAFGGWSAAWGGSVATVEQCPRSSVQGMLYRLGKGDLDALDDFEGYPYAYGREELLVRLPNGDPVRALVYYLNNFSEGQPSDRYLGKIARAYFRHGLPTEGLKMAIEKAPEKDYRVFVYGTLLSGQPNAPWAAGALREGPALLNGYTMHYYARGAFPAIAAGKGEVVGEVIRVDEATLERLDSLESEGQLYDRVVVTLAGGSQAYAYVMAAKKVAGLPRVKDGDWRAAVAARAMRKAGAA